MFAFITISALLLDSIFGEPKRYHPLVGFGCVAARVESLCNIFSGPDKDKFISFFLGSVCWALLVLLPAITVTLLSAWLVVLSGSAFLSIVLDIIVLSLALAHTSLREHALAVLSPLVRGDIVSARQYLGYIVSRDTQSLNPTAIRQACIETVLENGSDAIFAPLFWYLVGGLPAVVIYRLTNTLDAMWGYKTKRFNYFGRFSARMDDILNYLPSRLVGLSYALLGHTQSSLQCWYRQARLLDSPSAGVVMSAGAGALRVLLGGPCDYHGQRKNKPEFGCGDLPKNEDVERSLRLVFHTLLLWSCVIILFYLITVSFDFSAPNFSSVSDVDV